MANNLVPDLTQQVKHLTEDVQSLKENNKFLFDKLDKALGDRIELRAENYQLKEQLKNGNGHARMEEPEEECVACSA